LKPSTATRRKNGKVRERRLDSGSSESDAERKEDGAKASQSNGVHSPNRRDSMDEEKMSSAESKEGKEPTLCEGDAGKSSADHASEKKMDKDAGGMGKRGQITSKSINSRGDLGSPVIPRAKQKPGEDKKKDDPSERNQNADEVEKRNGGHTHEKAKKTSAQEVKQVATASGNTKKGKTGKADELERNGTGISDKLEKDEGTKVDSKRKEKEKSAERSVVNNGIEAIEEFDTTITTAAAATDGAGWKVASSGRTRAAKHETEPAKKVLKKRESRRARKEWSPSKEEEEEERTETGSWTQVQQDMLEWGLSKHPKSSEDRWINIANSVPGKTMVSVLAVKVSISIS